MAKPPTPSTIAAALTVPERVLLFCIASGTDWVTAGVTHAAAQHMVVRNLVERTYAGPGRKLAATGFDPSAVGPASRLAGLDHSHRPLLLSFRVAQMPRQPTFCNSSPILCAK